MTDVLMPSLSDSMTEGVIAAWLADDGDDIAIGDPLLEVETDKATMVVEAEAAGVLSILLAAGETAAVGAAIASVGSRSSAAVDAKPATATDTTTHVAGASDSATQTQRADGRPKASPVARRIALGRGVDLSSVVGSGPKGRIVKADVLAVATGPAVQDASAPNGAARGPAPDVEPPRSERPPVATTSTDHPLTRRQQVVARRMLAAHTGIPDFLLQLTVDADALVRLREDLRGRAEPLPSYNDIVVKACGVALGRHPKVNASFADDHLIIHDHISVGIAVASDDGLVVPTITDVDRRGFTAIASEAKRLARAVRENTITPAELDGATFTVSNLGMFDIEVFAPIINPPQAAILGVGALREELARRDGDVIDVHRMTITLACDHRVLNGADGARFLGTIRDLLQSPLTMLL